MKRLQLTAADFLSLSIGGLIGLVLAVGVAESMLRRGARR